MDGCDRCARGGAYITTGTEAQKAVRCHLWARVVGSSPACSIFLLLPIKSLLSLLDFPGLILVTILIRAARCLLCKPHLSTWGLHAI